MKIVQIPLDVIWQDPGDVSSLNLLYGSGGADGAPTAPFQFVDEDTTASNPKVNVKDARGRSWNVKWGDEARPEVFCSRVAWACGYVTEDEYFVPRGQILGVHGLKRAAKRVDRAGNFADARFQLRSDWPKFLKNRSWEWDKNPFVGTRELNGLRVLMMFVSNWDDKDARDASRDTNLAVFETNENPHRFLYFVSDWGASMGRWGKVATRDKWDCKGFTAQTPSFVTGVSNGLVHFGYVGQHSGLQKNDVRVSDVAWILKYLGEISDEQFRQALTTAGASPEECACYGRALRARVNQLRNATANLNYPEPKAAEPAPPATPPQGLYPPPPPAQPQAQPGAQPPAEQPTASEPAPQPQLYPPPPRP
ncbi:MAG TPA: hypothetical protein VFA04_07025 [Bryobacteraceae bacterium]|nr:hypothetical protein [Bryobacteraceae bacterium]